MNWRASQWKVISLHISYPFNFIAYISCLSGKVNQGGLSLSFAYTNWSKCQKIINCKVISYLNAGFERLSSLKKLKFLDLSYNVLNGSAMSALNNLVSLKTLILNSNGMVGQLPPSTGMTLIHSERYRFNWFHL